jgi:hypothetical protein
LGVTASSQSYPAATLMDFPAVLVAVLIGVTDRE